jgi:hypothetical protein
VQPSLLAEVVLQHLPEGRRVVLGDLRPALEMPLRYVGVVERRPRPRTYWHRDRRMSLVFESEYPFGRSCGELPVSLCFDKYGPPPLTFFVDSLGGSLQQLGQPDPDLLGISRAASRRLLLTGPLANCPRPSAALAAWCETPTALAR